MNTTFHPIPVLEALHGDHFSAFLCDDDMFWVLSNTHLSVSCGPFSSCSDALKMLRASNEFFNTLL